MPWVATIENGLSVKGHKNSRPVKDVLMNCWEYEYSQEASFGWDANNEAQKMYNI